MKDDGKTAQGQKEQPAHIAEQLEVAAVLLEKGWAQGSPGAFDAAGIGQSYGSPKATRFCVDAALFRLGDFYHSAKSFVYRVTNAKNLAVWNDKKGRTQAEVVAAVRKAAELARATNA